MNQYLETTRVAIIVTQEDIDVARLTESEVKPTERRGLYTVDFNDVADVSQDFKDGDKNEVTVITLKTGHIRMLDMAYKDFAGPHRKWRERPSAKGIKLDKYLK